MSNTIKLGNLKPLSEYEEELVRIQQEIEVGLATGTLIKSDIELFTRAEELMIIITFIKSNAKLKVSSDNNE